MADARYDVLTIGNAIVDVLSHCDEGFLREQNLIKGSMRLIDAIEAARLYDAMGPSHMVSGGCAGNTAAGVASLGGRTAFIGKVADDHLGQFYRHDLAAADIAYPTAALSDGVPTARSMILITPDSERTMNTHLGACQELAPGDIDEETVSGALVTYLEGYLWDPPKAKKAFRVASEISHRAGRQVAITLSDSFCVDRYREEFLELMRTGAVDILFANHHEVMALYQTSDFDTAMRLLETDITIAAVTRGADGSMVYAGGEWSNINAPPVDLNIVDKTGAGDLYAAGFLYGFACGMPPRRCAELGSLAAGEVLTHIGARPERSLGNLAQQSGLL